MDMNVALWQFAFGATPELKAASPVSRKSVHSIQDWDHVHGDRHAPIQVVEYGDYTCANCARASGVVKAIVEHFGSRLAFVFRYSPGTERHPLAQLTAEAAEAA